MDALRQYTQLYEANREQLRATGAAALDHARHAAYQSLMAPDAAFPRKGSEGYAHVDIESMFAPDYGVNLRRLNFDVDMSKAARCDVPNISTLMAVVANDVFRPTNTLLRSLPAGATMMSLAQAAASPEFAPIVEKYYGKVARRNTAEALNTMLCTDGVFIYLTPGTVLDKPLQLINIFNTEMPLMASRRMLIVVGEGAAGRLLVCDHTRRPDVDYLSNQVTEIVLATGASFDLYDMEESSARTRRLHQVYARQEADSDLRISSISLVGGITRNNYTVRLDGRGARNTIAGMVTGADTMLTDNSTTVEHVADHCESNQLFKYVLSDCSTGAFEGLIRVNPGAEHTSAYQTNRNVLASPDARMHTDPQLEIYCDEVKASHGATVGQLDPAALFYMRSRGIPEAEARMMLMQAFMADVVDTIQIPALRDRLTHLIEKRLHGTPALCDNCNI